MLNLSYSVPFDDYNRFFFIKTGGVVSQVVETRIRALKCADAQTLQELQSRTHRGNQDQRGEGSRDVHCTM